MSDHLPKPTPPEFFSQEMASGYDERNSRLAAISDNMHFLVGLVLADLPARARVLCVGVGTGAEILALAKANPQWSFVGLDPSAHMLEVCRDRLARADVLDRCELIHGYVDDAPAGDGFDAVLSILVAHFVRREDRAGFYRNIHDRLKAGGRYVTTEISCDLNAAEFPDALKDWARVQALMGATPATLQALPDTLRDVLSVLSPIETEAMLRDAGYHLPVQFFQAFLVRGWHAARDRPVRSFASSL